MNSISDSEATYCLEVEELMKSELNSSSNLSLRRSQRLSQKRLTDSSISVNNVYKSLLKQKLPNANESLKVDVLQKTTQDVFSTEDLREARESALTCRQPQVDVSVSEKDVPLNLSMKYEGFVNEIVFTQDLREHKDSQYDDLNRKQQRVVTLNENISNISVTVPAISKKEEFLGTRKESLSTKSKVSQKEKSAAYLRDNLLIRFIKTSNENIKQHLSCSKNGDIALKCVSVQDSQQKQPNQNHDIKPLRLQQKLSNEVKTRGRPRKKSNTQEQSNKKRIKCLAKNKELNMNVMKVNANPNDLEYGKKATAKNTQNLLTKSILPDVYPSHFKYQLPPEAVLSRPLVPYPTIITPETTPSYELEASSSTSPSLPGSLRDIFDTDDIKEIFNMEKMSYRLHDYHVQALAVILNLRIEYLLEMLDKILQMNFNALKSMDKAMKTPFVEDRDLFETTPEGSPTNEDIVQNSQSPKDRKILSQKKHLI